MALAHTASVRASLFAGPRRSGSGIRAALAEHAPAELADFERDFQEAVQVAAASYDTVPIDEVLDQWWRIAVLRSLTLSEEDQDQARRARRSCCASTQSLEEAPRTRPRQQPDDRCREALDRMPAW